MSRRASARVAPPAQNRREGDNETSTRLPAMGTVMTLSRVTIEHREAFELRAPDGWHANIATMRDALRLCITYQWKVRAALRFESETEADTFYTMSGASPPQGSRS